MACLEDVEYPGMVDDYPGPYFNHPDCAHSNEKSMPIIAEGIAKLVRPCFESWKKTVG